MESMEFGIEKPSHRGEKKRFKYTVNKEIKIGGEGQKCIADVESEKGQHGKYFVKWGSGKIDFEKYKFLKDNDVPVPRLLKPVRGRNNFPMLLVTDLSEDGKKEVLSPNNNEVYENEYEGKIAKISEKTKEKIREDLIHAIEVASGISRVNSDDEHIYVLIQNAYALIFDSNNPDDARLSVIDYGKDVWELKQNNHHAQNALETNILQAAVFYASMLLETLKLPDKYSEYQKRCDDVAQTIFKNRPDLMNVLKRTGQLHM